MTERPTISFNGVEFTYNEACSGFYKHDYHFVAEKIVSGEWDQLATIRQLMMNDLWFLLYFICKPFSDKKGMEKCNSPFVVQYCREVESGPQTYTLDLAARFHYKTSIFSAEILQYQMKNPNHATAIISYIAPVAKDILFGIRATIENEKILCACCPEIFWEEPQRDAPMWSIDEGIILRRQSNRREPSISAYGLVQGMPTGPHFDNILFDDCSTEKTAESGEMMEAIKKKFDSAKNLGSISGYRHRVVGTFYHHDDPLVYIKNKTVLDKETGNRVPQYHVRFKPATDDGTADGRPVLMDQDHLDSLKGDKTFACQQLLNPTPDGQKKLDPDLLVECSPEFVPQRCYNFLLVDPAGDDATNKTKQGDAWSIMLIGVDPQTDDLGASDIYIKNAFIDKLSEGEAVDLISRMYLTGGIISMFGYEKFGNFTPAVASQVLAALKKAGRKVSEELGNFMWLRPAGRNKKLKIVNALHWPLINGKIHISTKVPLPYRDRIKQEMNLFPLWHDDGLDDMAYLWDILDDRSIKLLLGRNPTPPRSVTSIMSRMKLTFNG